MLWCLPWSENFKKRACRYLLQRYLGNFLEEKLTLDQLSVDLYNGTGTVSDVSLDCEALNELGDSQNWPLEIVDGYMKEITVTIPWASLLKDDSVVVVDGLLLTVQPKVRAEPVSSMLESMWSSMSSSMQLAADCLRQEDGPPETNPVEGIEMFAHAIDSILSRVKVKFVNTKLRIEHVPKNSDRGIALEFHIEHIEYFDEAGTEPPPEATDPDKPKSYIVSTYTNKKIKFEGVTLYTDEFPSKLRTMARSLIMEKSNASQPEKTPEPTQIETSDINYQSTISDVFYETRSVISTAEPEPARNEFLDAVSKNVNVFQREVTPEERASQPQPILFAKITGSQELALKIKHTEEAIGPKVDLQMALGSLIVFMTPRQLQTLLELVDGLNQPQLEDTSNIPIRAAGVNMQCKPMGQADFHRIESQLLGNFRREQKPNLAMYGWTGQSFEDTESEDQFHPMGRVGGDPMTDSFISSASSLNTSMTSSVNLPNALPRIKRNRKVPLIDGDPTADVSHINIKLTSFSCILLHKDILVPVPLGTDCVTPSSAKRMQQASTEFFNRIGMFTINNKKEFDQANEMYDRATGRNHLRLITTAINTDGSEKTTSSGSMVLCDVSIAHLLLRETLYPRTSEGRKASCADLIRFTWNAEDDEEADASSVENPNLTISLKQTLKYIRVSGEKKLLYPTTDLSIKCMPFTVDVELTVLERMSSAAFVPPARTARPAPPPSNAHFNFSLQCANIDAILRFPVADLRANISREYRRIRPDYLLFGFQDVLVSSQQSPTLRPLPTTVTLRATTLDLYYYENETSQGTHIARTNMDDTYEPHGSTPTLPTISLTFRPPKPVKGPFDPPSDDDAAYEPVSNPMTTSMYMMDNLRSKQPTPFSNKKTAHQSTVKHDESPHGQVDELIVPGNEEEMAEFTNYSVDLAAIHLDLGLPLLSLQLESKQLYEIIYNRINSDLLLWEPQIMEHYETSSNSGNSEYGDEPNIYPAFTSCKNTGYDSDSSSTSEENLYYSAHENKFKQKSNAKKSANKSGVHNFCLTLKINRGLLTIYAPARDSNKHVVPGQMGELVLEASNLAMCQVSGLNGVLKTAQLCLRATKTTLYHEALMSIPTEKPPLRVYGNSLPSHVKETIYPSHKGVILKDQLVKKDMFTLALNVEPTSDSFKKVCLAVGIEQATLRHYMRSGPGVAWLSQLLDVLDVSDYVVPGYQPTSVITEIHAHISDCAVDYRPLHLPIRSVITLGNFSIANNVIPETNTSSLRFLAQECALFLSHVSGSKPGVPVPVGDKRPELSRNYICVVDVGLFELSLRIADKSNTTGPHVDLSCSNNVVNIYTCWDSASALCRLVTYIAIDGDNQPLVEPSSRHTSFCSDKGIDPNLLVGIEDSVEEIRELSQNEIQQVHDLMEEAMKESPNTTLEEEEINTSSDKEGVEIFFFPDESNMKHFKAETEPAPSADFHELNPAVPETGEEMKPSNITVANELGDPSMAPKPAPRKPKRTKKRSKTESSSNTDDEYCIVDSQIPCEDDDLAEPVAVFYDSEPVLYVDEHFDTPMDRADVLKAPKSFPTPTLRYTLCEMSIVWHLYGGNDFKLPGEVAPSTQVKKNVTINEGASKQGSPKFAKHEPYEPYEVGRAVTESYRRSGVRWTAGSDRVRSQADQPTKPNWRTRGGQHRDHKTSVIIQLNKVKFQHETYPSGGTHASRQVLAINKIEVLDRLDNSRINKLLSHYKLKDEPERQNAHMLVVKAVHLRPDPSLSAQECCLKVSLLPLRFNIDQDTLAFLMNFFPKLGSDEASDEDTKSLGGASSESGGSRQTTPTHRPPVMSVGKGLRDPPATPTTLPDGGDSLSLSDTMTGEPLMEQYQAERLVSENLIQLEEDFQRLGVGQPPPPVALPTDVEPLDDSPIYFRRVVFSPDVPIRLDYEGKRVDMSAGPVAGLLLGLGQLNFSELTLRRLYHRNGLLGLERLLHWALNEWLSDIKRNQLGRLLGGLGPMHSLIQFATGIRDLLWLPVEQWRRDGRLVHGLRRGAASFTARTAVAALDITTRILQVIQATAETAFDMLTPGPTLQLQDNYQRRQRRLRRRHDPSRYPTDIREGVASAYHHMREGFAETAATITIAARSESGVGVLRHLPGAAVAPLALAAAGAADVLGGVRAHLAPDAKRDLADKWRPPTEPSAE